MSNGDEMTPPQQAAGSQLTDDGPDSVEIALLASDALEAAAKLNNFHWEDGQHYTLAEYERAAVLLNKACECLAHWRAKAGT